MARVGSGSATLDADCAGMELEVLCRRAAKKGKLGKREYEVLMRLLAGETEARIATELGISPHTVRTHVRNLYLKLDVHSRTDLFRQVIALGG